MSNITMHPNNYSYNWSLKPNRHKQREREKERGGGGGLINPSDKHIFREKRANTFKEFALFALGRFKEFLINPMWLVNYKAHWANIFFFPPTSHARKHLSKKNPNLSVKSFVQLWQEENSSEELIFSFPTMTIRSHDSEIPSYGKILARNTIWVFIKQKNVIFHYMLISYLILFRIFTTLL